MRFRYCELVEAVGVEPTSENTFKVISPSASARRFSPMQASDSPACIGQPLNCQWIGTTSKDRSLLS